MRIPSLSGLASSPRSWPAASLFFLLGGLLPQWAAPSPEAILEGAPQRIALHRQAPAQIRLVNAQNQPVAQADLTVRQTRHAFLFGCNIFQWGKLPTPELQEAYRRHYADLLNYATLPFYWPSYEREQGKPMHEQTEEVARWCQQHHILTKGHPLAWNMGDPPWLPDDSQAIFRLQQDRIRDCVNRFAGLIDRWDVVNEATHFDREEFVNRLAPKHSAMWKEIGQIPFTIACFEEARRAHPQATLLINDYRTDPAFEKVIEQLVDGQGRRLYDVIGIQSHMHGGVWPTEKVWETCERFSRFGVPLHFTETTILSGEHGWERPAPWPSTPEGEAEQARQTVRFYTLLFSHPAVEAITWWDFCDHYAWQQAPAGFLRRDMTPKPVYHALQDLIKKQWWTSLTVQTDAQGQARFRGFLGDYRLTARLGDQSVAMEVTLTKDLPNSWVLRLPTGAPPSP